MIWNILASISCHCFKKGKFYNTFFPQVLIFQRQNIIPKNWVRDYFPLHWPINVWKYLLWFHFTQQGMSKFHCVAFFCRFELYYLTRFFLYFISLSLSLYLYIYLSNPPSISLSASLSIYLSIFHPFLLHFFCIQKTPHSKMI